MHSRDSFNSQPSLVLSQSYYCPVASLCVCVCVCAQANIVNDESELGLFGLN